MGLGNPGAKYAGTRHNLGFEVALRFANQHGGRSLGQALHAELLAASVDGRHVLVLLPRTYMNLSGRAVRAAIEQLQLELDQFLVVCDDLNLPLGKLRFRPAGSAGGHRGLENIIEQLGTDQFHRLRIGIGRLRPGEDAVDFVLRRFLPEEVSVIEEAIERAAEAVATWCRAGIRACMNRFN